MVLTLADHRLTTTWIVPVCPFQGIVWGDAHSGWLSVVGDDAVMLSVKPHLRRIVMEDRTNPATETHRPNRR